MLGTGPVSDGTATVTLPAYDARARTSPSSTAARRRATPSSPRHLRGRQGDPDDDGDGAARRDPQGETAPARGRARRTRPDRDRHVVVRQNGRSSAVEPLAAGRATVLPPYKQQGEQTVTVEYLGSDLGGGSHPPGQVHRRELAQDPAGGGWSRRPGAALAAHGSGRATTRRPHGVCGQQAFRGLRHGASITAIVHREMHTRLSLSSTIRTSQTWLATTQRDRPDRAGDPAGGNRPQVVGIDHLAEK